MRRKPFVTGFGISVNPGPFVGVFGFFCGNFSMTEPSIEPESGVLTQRNPERPPETLLPPLANNWNISAAGIAVFEGDIGSADRVAIPQVKLRLTWAKDADPNTIVACHCSLQSNAGEGTQIRLAIERQP
jgi:hypothetical protein